jgi:hypothetical protein
MHNEYVTTCCILNKKDKLNLLKFADVDISETSNLLEQITLDLMNQCYKHVDEFHKLNKKNKRYSKLEPFIIEQMKDMLFVKKKFIEYFSSTGKKSKEDLYTYVLASQISINYYSEYLYHVLVESIKKEFTFDFWDKYMLDLFQLHNFNFSDYYILKDKEQECSTGKVDISLEHSVSIFDEYTKEKSKSETIEKKLAVIKQVSNVLENFYCPEIRNFNRPYKDSILELIDNIKVYISIDKPKQLIKRI